MNASEEKEPSLVDLELAIMHRIAQRTAGRIHALEVEVVADRIEIRGRAPSYYLKQLATHAALDEVGSCCNSPRGGMDVLITVKPATECKSEDSVH
jgi:hypothetical protein